VKLGRDNKIDGSGPDYWAKQKTEEFGFVKTFMNDFGNINMDFINFSNLILSSSIGDGIHNG
jgi:hypothetical protein